MITTTDAIIASWPIDKPFDARLAISLHLVTDAEVVEKLAVQEFMDLVSSDVHVDPVEFAQRFPEVEDTLLSSIVDLLDRVGFDYLRDEALCNYKPVRPLSLRVHSQVYLAEDQTAQGRLVVIKITSDGHREIAAHARVTHQGICRLLTSVTLSTQSRTALIFEYAGASQTTSKTPLLQKCHLALIADAIEHCHRVGLSHNDISPDNIVIHQGVPKLIDFGSASNVNTPPSERHIGRLPFVSCQTLAELSQEGKLVSPSSFQDDCYAFMILAFEVWYGKAPQKSVCNGGPIDSTLCEQFLQMRRSIDSGHLRALGVPHALRRTFIEWIGGEFTPPTPSSLIREMMQVSNSRRFFRSASCLGGLVIISLLMLILVTHFSSAPSARSSVSIKPREFELVALNQIRAGLVNEAQQTLMANKRNWSRMGLSLAAYCKIECEANEDEALRLLGEAIEFGEDDPKVLTNFGVLLSRAAKAPEARAILNKAKVIPGAERAYLHLAALDLAQCDRDRARAIQSAIAMLEHCPRVKAANTIASILSTKLGEKPNLLSERELFLLEELRSRLDEVPSNAQLDNTPLKMQEVPFNSEPAL